MSEPLPIDSVLAPLKQALTVSPRAVLVAPPGAGKTTRVPLALIGEPWLERRKVIVLEPRRIAARGAASHMAHLLGERLGDTVGLRARLATRVGPRTRVEVVTEGVFTRMILDDPTLEGVGAVLLDEFHERSLDADLALALALDAQAGLRPDLRVLVMSATLDAARVGTLLGGAPVIASEGRAFPVDTRYLGRDPSTRIEDAVADAVMRAVRTEPGSILAFLPGQAEIRRTCDLLADRISDTAIDICPLYGAMDMPAQDAAIRPAPAGRRKVVLATAIAETSITIEGVRVVVDCGLARVPRYEPDVGVTRLETVRVSRAAADQRRGRAGRTEPGVCYRLWHEPETQSLAAFAEPEIRAADLSGLLLDCAAWGVTEPARLSWLDPPPAASLAAARADLEALGALDEVGRITAHGRSLRALPLPARLAAMIVSAAQGGNALAAAEIAAVIVERGIGGNDPDLDVRLAAFRRDRSRRAQDLRELARGWARSADPPSGLQAAAPASAAALLALAYPERIAMARGMPGQFLLANGRAAAVVPTHALAKAPLLVIAELAGKAATTRILLAAALEPAELDAAAGARIETADELAFDPAAAALRARRTRRLGAIVLEATPIPVPATPASAEALAEGIAGLGVARLPWSKAQADLRTRIAFMRKAGDREMPDLSDAALAATVRQWLSPYLAGKTRLAEISADDLAAALDAQVPWRTRQRVEAEVPSHFAAPTGNRHPIDYEGEHAPSLHIRVQELFGLKHHPAVAGGRLPLTLFLLSPAQRPIQITRDLPGFWKGSWSAVKAEMKGRYPKHPWPEDPANALPTARAKPRGT